MTLDITVDHESEEIAMVVDDHQVIKFEWNSQRKESVPSNKAAREMRDEDDTDLFDVLESISTRLFTMKQ